VLRLVWEPKHFVDGKFDSSNFGRKELKGTLGTDGKPQYASVDKLDLIVSKSIDWRIQWQQRGNLIVSEKRAVAHFAKFEVPNLNQAQWENGDPMFQVTAEPTVDGEEGEGSPANPAHCGIRGADRTKISKAESENCVALMRAELVAICSKIFQYEELFPAD